VNIPSYLLVEFNDRGPDITQNVITYPATQDVEEFKRKKLSFLLWLLLLLLLVILWVCFG
jgi:hypothetical protein